VPTRSPVVVPRPGPRPVASGLACALLAAFPLSAQATDLAMVRSSDLAQYRSLQQAFAASSGPSLDLNLGDPQVAGDLGGALQGATVVVAVGPGAAAAVKAARPAARVLYALVPNGAEADAAVIPTLASSARQLAVFKSAVPKLRHLGMLYGPTMSPAVLAEHVAAAAKAGLTLHTRQVRTREEAVEWARQLLQWVDGFWLVPDPTVVTNETYRIFVQAALAARVPLLGYSEGMARTGALVAVEASYAEMGRCAAQAAKRLRDGAPASPGPLEGRVFLNARVAGLIDLQLPPEVRETAAGVFE